MNRYLHKGFTLAEMLIVMAIIGILASMMMVSSTQSVQTTKAGNIVSTLRNFASAAMTFYTDSMDYFTKDPGALSTNPDEMKRWVKKYMYSEGSTVQDDGKYYVKNDSGTWWVGYDLANASDADGLKVRLEGRATAANLKGTSDIGTLPDKTSPAYTKSNQAVWLLIR